jgi:hypothetical protein
MTDHQLQSGNHHHYLLSVPYCLLSAFLPEEKNDIDYGKKAGEPADN